jgi:predicted sugar kinase
MYHGIVPAILERDLSELAANLRKFQRAGFKHAEIIAQTSNVIGLIEDLEGLHSGAVGMSSLGPLVYFVTEDGFDPLQLAPMLKNRKAKHLGTFSARNYGVESE